MDEYLVQKELCKKRKWSEAFLTEDTFVGPYKWKDLKNVVLTEKYYKKSKWFVSFYDMI